MSCWCGVAMLLIAAGVTACGGPMLMPRAKAPELDTGQAKCKVAASRSSPLVTEWPASDKANLEVRLREGAVVVAYSGCEMRLISECRPGGRYQWRRTTPASDLIEIGSEDELYAKLPLGAVSLEGELRASGRLSMRTTVSGQLRLTGVPRERLVRAGPCAQASHLLTALSVGAFRLSSGGNLKGSAAGSVVGVAQAGAGTASSERLLREAGVAERCAESTAAAPHAECRSPIQMFLEPLPWVSAAQAPPGTIGVEFVSADAGIPWEVVTGGEAICETPCNRFVPPATPFAMRARDPSMLRPGSEITVPSLREHAAMAPLQVRAHPTSMGLFATGVTFTALSGLAVVAGIPLTAVGGASGDGDLLTAGLVTGGGGLGVLVPSIVILVKGLAHAEIIGEGAALDARDVGWQGSF